MRTAQRSHHPQHDKPAARCCLQEFDLPVDDSWVLGSRVSGGGGRAAAPDDERAGGSLLLVVPFPTRLRVGFTQRPHRREVRLELKPSRYLNCTLSASPWRAQPLPALHLRFHLFRECHTDNRGLHWLHHGGAVAAF
jgi:hypothetical protein